MEKKIMKPAEICITRRLPILVDPSNPTFSLHHCASQVVSRLVIKTSAEAQW
jgi:competence transcription factor ComK